MKKIEGLNLDRNLSTYEERLALTEREMARVGEENLTPKQLEALSWYLIEASGVEARGGIITTNRMVTLSRRETSTEGLVEKLEGGESAFHNLIRHDKHRILTPKVEITDEDIEEVPGLSQLRDEIDKLQHELDTNDELTPATRGKLKQVIIEMRKDQYVMKNAYRQPIFTKGDRGDMEQNLAYDISLQDPAQVEILLVEYAFLKQEFDDDNQSDLKWILVDLENLAKEAFVNHPSLAFILQAKLDGWTNKDIKEELANRYGITHTQEYISALYRNKIPAMIANKATEQWIDNIYMNKLKGTYKRCTRCHQIKLESNRNFSLNKSKTAEYYSICKSCRNKK